MQKKFIYKLTYRIEKLSSFRGGWLPRASPTFFLIDLQMTFFLFLRIYIPPINIMQVNCTSALGVT